MESPRKVAFCGLGIMGAPMAENLRRAGFEVSGWTQTASRSPTSSPAEAAEGADVLIVQGGVNDIAQGIPPAPAARNLRAMVRRGKQLKLRVAIVELLPWNGGYPRADRPIRELNRRIALIGGEEDVPVLQWYDELEDPRQPGRMRVDLTVDLVHPSVKGYRRLGESVELP